MTVQAVFVLTCDTCTDLFTYNTYHMVQDVLKAEGWAVLDNDKHMCPRCCALEVATAELSD